MLITAGVFALASLPTFLLLRERARPACRRPSASGRTRFARPARHRAGGGATATFAVFACGTFYQAGVATVIALAAIYASR